MVGRVNQLPIHMFFFFEYQPDCSIIWCPACLRKARCLASTSQRLCFQGESQRLSAAGMGGSSCRNSLPQDAEARVVPEYRTIVRRSAALGFGAPSDR